MNTEGKPTSNAPACNKRALPLLILGGLNHFTWGFTSSGLWVLSDMNLHRYLLLWLSVSSVVAIWWSSYTEVKKEGVYPQGQSMVEAGGEHSWQRWIRDAMLCTVHTCSLVKCSRFLLQPFHDVREGVVYMSLELKTWPWSWHINETGYKMVCCICSQHASSHQTDQLS